MGKVRKLRKKYHALCVKSRTEYETSKPKADVQSLISNSDARSTYSISKTIKSSVSGINKKDKQKLKHAIFLQRINASSKVLQSTEKSNYRNKIILNDNLPSITSSMNICEDRFKKLKTKMKPNNQKGISKIRQKTLVDDVFLFKKTLNDQSFLKNPTEAITNATLNKLSKESLGMDAS